MLPRNSDEGLARQRSIDVAIRLLEPDERRVVEALIAASGTMLQKDISHELGFTRVKTHRVIVKLLRRGVVTTERYYNTNRIELGDEVKDIALIGESFACKAISDREGVSGELEKLDVKVEYVGSIISNLIKEGYLTMVC